ncbi:DUF2764 family protein [candidate division KSB1 bacterium]|nr:DUF2764 family protein [candidate division KSB1 bacterium]
MDKYYYLIAELPTLFLGKEPNITVQKFLEEAQNWMDAKDYQALSQVDMNDFDAMKKINQVYDDYKLFENKIRTDIALWREAQKRDQEYKPSSFPVSAIKEGNPLEVELRLMEMRWQFIDELEREHHFDLGYLILYYLKLQILQRFFIFNKEQGMKKFQKLCEVNT